MRRFQVIINGTNAVNVTDGKAKSVGFVVTRIVASVEGREAELSALAEVRDLWNLRRAGEALPILNVLEINELPLSDEHEYVSTGFVFYEEGTR